MEAARIGVVFKLMSLVKQSRDGVAVVDMNAIARKTTKQKVVTLLEGSVLLPASSDLPPELCTAHCLVSISEEVTLHISQIRWQTCAIPEGALIYRRPVHGFRRRAQSPLALCIQSST